jgi:hypothetical protein
MPENDHFRAPTIYRRYARLPTGTTVCSPGATVFALESPSERPFAPEKPEAPARSEEKLRIWAKRKSILISDDIWGHPRIEQLILSQTPDDDKTIETVANDRNALNLQASTHG